MPQTATHKFESLDGSTVIERSLTRDQLMELPLDNSNKRLYIEADGVRFYRQRPKAGISFMEYDHADYPRVSSALPRWADGAEHTDKGKPIVTSAQHARELCRRHGYTREYAS